MFHLTGLSKTCLDNVTQVVLVAKKRFRNVCEQKCEKQVYNVFEVSLWNEYHYLNFVAKPDSSFGKLRQHFNVNFQVPKYLLRLHLQTWIFSTNYPQSTYPHKVLQTLPWA